MRRFNASAFPVGRFCTVLLCVGVVCVMGPSAASAQTEETQPEAEETQPCDQKNEQKIESLENELEELRKEFDQFKDELEKSKEDQELEELRRMAEMEAETEAQPEEELEGKKFRFKGIGLQTLNPEISVVIDTLLVGKYKDVEGERPEAARDFFDAGVRMLAVHFQTYLDPYTKLFAAYPVMPGGSSLGEAYITRFGLLSGMSITVGQFRQWFCEVNRWHKPALDQTDFPLALRKIFGGGGLAQTGMGLEWHLGSGSTAHGLFFQVTEAANGALFAGNSSGTPSLLFRYLLYNDLSDETYLELGLTGLWGWPDKWTVNGETKYSAEMAAVYGFEFHLTWEPTDSMRYNNVEWRTEAYLLDRTVLPPDGSESDHLLSWGLYSYLQAKVARTWDVGLRFDWYQPDVKKYDVTAFGSHAVSGDFDEAYMWQVSPYVTWWQSPWVKVRLQFDYIDGHNMADPEYLFTLQVITAGGPHLHERY